MSFAPSNKYTAHAVLSMARELSKTIEVGKVLEMQGKFFYQLSLLEIVTLLNGALEKGYLSYVNAYGQATGDQDTSITNPELTLKMQNDVWLPSATNIICINLLQKRVAGAGVNGILYDPLVGKQIDKVTAVEYRIEGAGATGSSKWEGINDIYKNLGGLHKAEFEELQSLLRLDFKDASYKDDIIYSEIGGDSDYSVITYDVSPAEAWVSHDPLADYLPDTGTVATTKFPAYYLRLRADVNKVGDTGFWMKGSWTGTTNYVRPVVTIWYQRTPNFPANPSTGSLVTNDGWRPDSTHESRFVDLPDKFIPLLVKRIYTYCLLQMNMSIPQQLSFDIVNDYGQIMAMMNSEQQAKMLPNMNKIKQQMGN